MDRVAGEEFLKEYCKTHHIADVKGALWKWLVLSSKETTNLAVHVQTDEFAFFYDDLNKLLTAIYAVQKNDN